jgi:hypothetical protein
MTETEDTAGDKIAPRGRGCGQFFIAAIAGIAVLGVLTLLSVEETARVIASIVVMLVVYYALPATRVTLSDRVNRKLDR